LSGVARIIATWFGCGYAPKGPGTAGSVAALAIAWLLITYAGVSSIGLGWLALLLAIPGIWAADVVACESGRKDPQIVVVDEVVGQWMTLAGATALNWKSWLLALALFRLFDIWKPLGAREAQRLPGGWGIVIDDVMAGAYGLVILQVLLHFVWRPAA